MALLVLRRPPINALGRKELEEMSQAVEEIRADPQTRVLVIKGAASRINGPKGKMGGRPFPVVVQDTWSSLN